MTALRDHPLRIAMATSGHAASRSRCSASKIATSALRCGTAAAWSFAIPERQVSGAADKRQIDGRRVRRRSDRTRESTMADDMTMRAPQDVSLISLSEDYEVAYWTKKFGVSRRTWEAEKGL